MATCGSTTEDVTFSQVFITDLSKLQGDETKSIRVFQEGPGSYCSGGEFDRYRIYRSSREIRVPGEHSRGL